MNREEKKRKFNEAIVNMLYPPPPQHEPTPSQPEEELKPMQASMKWTCSDAISDTLDDSENPSKSGDEQQMCEPQKLTRAQRKKLRKKKLKEEAIRRGKMIGPLLPLTPTNQGADVDSEDTPAVRSNASESGENSGADEPRVLLPCANTKKVKQRRIAKRMAKEKKNSSNSENCNQHSMSCPSVGLKEPH